MHLDQNKVWELTNAENADTPVLKDPKLCEYARLRVDGFWKAAGNGGLDYLNHEGFSATNQEFMLENGFARVGEIIVKTDYDDNGTTDYNKKVVKMWMDSPTHKAIITDDTHTRGCIECEGNHCVGIYGETVDEWYQRQEGLR